MLESKIQKKILDAIKARGGYSAKVIRASKEGVPDVLVCWPMIVTQEMVGTEIGAFVAVEVKNETGRLSPLQVKNGQMIEEASGLFCVARSVEDFLSAVGHD